VNTIPGVQEALEEGRYDYAQAEMARVVKVLQDEAALIDSASSELEKSGH
jgi:hypothetical protein